MAGPMGPLLETTKAADAADPNQPSMPTKEDLIKKAILDNFSVDQAVDIHDKYTEGYGVAEKKDKPGFQNTVTKDLKAIEAATTQTDLEAAVATLVDDLWYKDEERASPLTFTALTPTEKAARKAGFENSADLEKDYQAKRDLLIKDVHKESSIPTINGNDSSETAEEKTARETRLTKAQERLAAFDKTVTEGFSEKDPKKVDTALSSVELPGGLPAPKAAFTKDAQAAFDKVQEQKKKDAFFTANTGTLAAITSGITGVSNAFTGVTSAVTAAAKAFKKESDTKTDPSAKNPDAKTPGGMASRIKTATDVIKTPDGEKTGSSNKTDENKNDALNLTKYKETLAKEKTDAATAAQALGAGAQSQAQAAKVKFDNFLRQIRERIRRYQLLTQTTSPHPQAVKFSVRN